jgi:hypothetical protein
MKKLLLLFAILMLAQITFAQKIDWYKDPNNKEDKKKEKQHFTDKVLYEDDENIYFVAGKVSSTNHYGASSASSLKDYGLNTYIGYVKMNKKTMTTELVKSTNKELKNGLVAMFAFGGKEYSLSKKYNRETDKTIDLMYYTDDYNDSQLIKKLPPVGKMTDHYSNNVVVGGLPYMMYNIAFSPNGEYMLYLQQYRSKNSMVALVLDKSMNLIADNEIILLDNKIDLKKSTIKELFIDDNGNYIIDWTAKSLESSDKKRRFPAITYYNKKEDKVFQKKLTVKGKWISGYKYQYKDGKLYVAAIAHSEDQGADLSNSSIVSGYYDTDENDWNYHVDNLFVENSINEFDLNREKQYSCFIQSIHVIGNTIMSSIYFDDYTQIKSSESSTSAKSNPLRGILGGGGKASPTKKMFKVRNYNMVAFHSLETGNLLSKHLAKNDNWNKKKVPPVANGIQSLGTKDAFNILFPIYKKEEKEYKYMFIAFDAKGNISNEKEIDWEYKKRYVVQSFLSPSGEWYLEIPMVVKYTNTTSTGIGGPKISSDGGYRFKEFQVSKIQF